MTCRYPRKRHPQRSPCRHLLTSLLGSTFASPIGAYYNRLLRENLVSTITTIHGHRHHHLPARRDRLAWIGRFACRYRIVEQYTTLHRQVRHSYSGSRCKHPYSSYTDHIATNTLTHPVQWRNGLDSTTESGSGIHIHHRTTILTPTLTFTIVLDSRYSLDFYIYS